MAANEPLHVDFDLGRQYLTPDQLRAKLEPIIPGGVSRRTLDRWDSRRIGPPRIRAGSRRVILYPVAGVQKWLDRLTAEAEAQIEAVNGARR